MKSDIHFWTVTLFRGFLALMAGSAVIALPDMARILFLMPFAVAISILCLAVYGLVDSALIFITSFMSESRPVRFCLALQGASGMLIGVVLLSMEFAQAQMHWFLYLIAFQALFTAAGEFFAARHGLSHGTTRWNYTAALIALAAMLLYTTTEATLGSGLQPAQLAWLIFGYLVAFGLAECLTSARMLYADVRLMMIAGEAQRTGGPHVTLDARPAR